MYFEGGANKICRMSGLGRESRGRGKLNSKVFLSEQLEGWISYYLSQGKITAGCFREKQLGIRSSVLGHWSLRSLFRHQMEMSGLQVDVWLWSWGEILGGKVDVWVTSRMCGNSKRHWEVTRNGKKTPQVWCPGTKWRSCFRKPKAAH